jgi:hypothetical protein
MPQMQQKAQAADVGDFLIGVSLGAQYALANHLWASGVEERCRTLDSMVNN